ncbi:MAG: hypothetical protein PHP45_00285 [Elusimicrobiales bacterium]|nr:hypothetical protein [Elusimicrobiales bacterium]
MIHAELKNKCGEWRTSEDALTSTVFGYLKYRLFRAELKGFFKCAINMHTRERYASLDWLDSVDVDSFKFWERNDNNNEIDLRITDRLGVEIKYGSNEHEYQLGKYLAESDELIYITMDSTLESALKSLNSEYAKEQLIKIYWLSWHYLHKVIVDSMGKTEHPNDGWSLTKKQMMKDLRDYLEKRSIRSFQGFGERETVVRLASPIFCKQIIFSGLSTPVPRLTTHIFFEEKTK